MQRSTIDLRPSRGGVRSQALKVTSGQAGVVAQLRSGLPGDVVYSKLSGSSNISISGSGAVSIADALADGVSQTAIVRALAAASNLAKEWPLTLTGATAPAPAPTPTPTPMLHSRADKYYVGSVGLRWPNRRVAISGTGAATKTKIGQTLVRNISPWVVPAGSQVVLAFPAVHMLEQNTATNEGFLLSPTTLEAVSIQYMDATSTLRTVNCSTGAGTITGSGALDTSATGGGVLAITDVLPAAIPANANVRIAFAKSFVAGAALLGTYSNRTGFDETSRTHDTASFASVVNAGLAMTANSGSQSGTIGGFYYGPVAVAVKGADGRDVAWIDGDSIAYGKGQSMRIAPDGIMGIAETLLARTEGGYRIPCINSAVAASGPRYADPTDPDYNPDIANKRRELIDQITTLNGGIPPFTLHVCQHGTNSLEAPYNTVTTFANMIKARHSWLKAWHSLPLVQFTMIQKATSTDQFQSATNQVVMNIDRTDGTRFLYNDKLMSDRLDGSADYAINTYAPLAFDNGANRDKIKVAPFTTTIAVGDAGSGDTLVLTHTPTLGAALNLAGDVMLAVTVAGGGPYTVTGGIGGSFGEYGARSVGDNVYEQYFSDGVSVDVGLHISQPANELVAPAGDAFKAARGVFL